MYHIERNTSGILRGGCSEGGHPSLEEAPPELERVLPHEDQVEELEDRELVEEDTRDDSHNEESQLRHDQGELGYA